MARRYLSGETLEEIGKDYGLTRERIRQIVTQVAGKTVSVEVRALRQNQKAVAVRKTQNQLLAEYGEFASMAAKDGMTIEETIKLIQEVEPSVDDRQLHRALLDSGLPFNKIHNGYAFPTELVHLGMWYLIAQKYKITVAPKDRPSNQDLATLRIRTGLGETDASNRQVLEIVAIAEAAKSYAKLNPTISITAKQYTDLRKIAEAELNIKAIRNNLSWPADKQTVTKRFGGWNESIHSIGLIPSSGGRPKGLLKFTEVQYLAAIIGYIQHSATQGVTPAAERYDPWAKSQRAKGISRPSMASIRNVYGTWNNSLRTGREVMEAEAAA